MPDEAGTEHEHRFEERSAGGPWIAIDRCAECGALPSTDWVLNRMGLSEEQSDA